MGKFGAVALAVVFLSSSAPAAIQPFPAEFKTETIATNGARIYVRIGGAGPAVVLLHGYGETGDMWAPLAARLSRDHTVIVPDLRGLGLSSRPARGYDKKTQGEDVAGLLDALKVDKVDLVTHDIGNMVGYAFAAEHPERVKKFVIIDAPLPGIGPWDDIIRSHALWHFSFYGPDAERLVQGRERIYLDPSGTNSLPIRKSLMKHRARTTPSFTRSPAPCMPDSSSSRPSIRMPPTTRHSSPRACSPCRFSQSVARNRSVR